MDRGLWRYTRHPNYFGDFCVWWGLYLIAAAGGAWLTIFSPLLMSFLLMKVSGVRLLERTIADRRPDYVAYMARTNAFFPGPPRADRITSTNTKRKGEWNLTNLLRFYTVDHDAFAQPGNLNGLFDDGQRVRLPRRIAGVLVQARPDVQMWQLCHFFPR